MFLAYWAVQKMTVQYGRIADLHPKSGFNARIMIGTAVLYSILIRVLPVRACLLKRDLAVVRPLSDLRYDVNERV